MTNFINHNESFETISIEWLKHIEPNVKYSTYSKYYSIIQKHLIPEFYKQNVSNITSTNIEQFGKNLVSKKNRVILAYSTVNTILCVLKSVLKYAQKKGIQTKTIDYFSLRVENKPIQILSEEEQKILSNHLIQKLGFRNFGVLLCMYTGLRIGEICALQINDIAYDEGVLKVCRTMQRLPTKEQDQRTAIIITQPKTPASIRTIPLPYELLHLIEMLNYPNNSYILTGTEKYIEPRTLQYSFKKMLKEAGINNVNFHVLRHTFATRCVELGFDIKTLSEILGHSSVNVTMNRYVHPSIALKRKNMDLLSSMLSVYL